MKSCNGDGDVHVCLCRHMQKYVSLFAAVKESWLPAGTYCYRDQCLLKAQCFFLVAGQLVFFFSSHFVIKT